MLHDSYTKSSLGDTDAVEQAIPACSWGIMGTPILWPPGLFGSCLLTLRKGLLPTLQSFLEHDKLLTDAKSTPGFLPRPLGSRMSAVEIPRGCGPRFPPKVDR